MFTEYTSTSTGQQVTDDELEALFDSQLDDINPTVVVSGHNLRPSQCLKTDNGAYRLEYNGWLDAMLRSGELEDTEDRAERLAAEAASERDFDCCVTVVAQHRHLDLDGNVEGGSTTAVVR